MEMVDSVDDLKSSRSIQGCTYFPNFEMLDASIASALNKIIQNSYFKKKVRLEKQKAQKEDRFLHGRQIAHVISISLSLFATMMFRNLVRDGMKFYHL